MCTKAYFVKDLIYNFPLVINKNGNIVNCY